MSIVLHYRVKVTNINEHDCSQQTTKKHLNKEKRWANFKEINRGKTIENWKIIDYQQTRDFSDIHGNSKKPVQQHVKSSFLVSHLLTIFQVSNLPDQCMCNNYHEKDCTWDIQQPFPVQIRLQHHWSLSVLPALSIFLAKRLWLQHKALSFLSWYHRCRMKTLH